MRIKYIDIKDQDKDIQPKILKRIKKIIDGSSFILGDNCIELERNIQKKWDVNFCVTTNSGTDALTIALTSLNLPAGSKVIIPANTFVATAEAVINASLVPLIIDCNPDGGMSLPQLTMAIKKEKDIKAIIPVHLHGKIDNITIICNLAKKNKLYVIEDACQAHGAKLNGKYAGTFGDIGCFSFYPGKNLGAYGDGGCIITNSKRLSTICRQLRDHGTVSKYKNKYAGFNSRLDEIQAAVLVEKLKHLNKNNEKRLAVARLYKKYLYGIKDVVTPKFDSNVFHVYSILVKNRNRLQAHLLSEGIPTIVHYPVPVHKQNPYKKYVFTTCPEAEKRAKKMLSLPMHPNLSKDELQYIADSIRRFYGK